jgi:hypothetical protein
MRKNERIKELLRLFCLVSIVLFSIATAAPGVYSDSAPMFAQPSDGPSFDDFINRTTAQGLGDNIVWGIYVSGNTGYAATTGGLSIDKAD